MSEEIKSQLTLDDIAAVQKIIDVASRRGAFAGEELESVGKVYNRISEFLKSAQPQEQADAETEQESN